MEQPTPAVHSEPSGSVLDDFGKAGPGGRPWRENRLQGQDFFEKMGWATSADQRRRKKEIEHYREALKQILAERKRAAREERQFRLDESGISVYPLMKQLATGRPRRQPDTELLYNPLPHTDVTRHREGRITYPPLEQSHYRRQLELQIQEKQQEKQRAREQYWQETVQHLESFSKFWGRPGGGAPISQQHKKANISRMLFPDAMQPQNVA
ncbi:uncharacterized protein LOC122373578 [Amphibalanus amphitrite]|uniref:uncharacterized protein LOC122373578 n=1 Tax=Amphibalanus amphitrite TaxID=1232801 RepID=UPI001C926D38|nr:uncharacterized protein LOC122373578 [Amphibalanus amphitrite]